MTDIFLSFRYDEPNKQLARLVEELLESHTLRATTGDVLGGEALTPEIKRQIEDADALIALLTRRDALQNGGWTTHPFCLQELQHARDAHKPAIALVEEGVGLGGFEQQNEHIAYQSANPLPAFLKLTQTIWRWKQRVGRSRNRRRPRRNVLEDPVGGGLGVSDPVRHARHVEGQAVGLRKA